MKSHWNEVKELKSTDTDVMKYIFTKEDAIAEAVLYKYGTFEERTVMCISTQTGCPMGCTFCGTGKFFGRNLTRYEIMAQVDHMIRVNNIDTDRVKKMQIMVMSMGEPVLNAHSVSDAFKYFDFMYPKAQLLISSSGPRSALGWEQILDISEKLPQVGLQFSVHESTDAARNKLMPMKAKLSLNQIAGMGEESIAGIQASLINAGLLETDAGFIAGDWGPTTQRAFSYILGMANRRGVTTQERETGSAWRSALSEFEQNPLPKYPDAEAYLPPDFDSVANSITTMFRRGVNRDPQPYELKLLANTLY